MTLLTSLCASVDLSLCRKNRVLSHKPQVPGTRPSCTTSEHQDDSVTGIVESTHNQEMSQTTALPQLMKLLKISGPARNLGADLWGRICLPSPQVASLLNETHIPFQSKLLSWVLAFRATGSWTWVSVTHLKEKDKRLLWHSIDNIQ